MTFAKEIKSKIESHYQGAVINYCDLAKHLMNNRVDYSEECPHKYKGYDSSTADVYPIIFYYSDDSFLALTGYCTITGTVDA